MFYPFYHSLLSFENLIEYADYCVYNFCEKLSKLALERLFDFENFRTKNFNLRILLFYFFEQFRSFRFVFIKRLQKFGNLLFLFLGKILISLEFGKCLIEFCNLSVEICYFLSVSVVAVLKSLYSRFLFGFRVFINNLINLSYFNVIRNYKTSSPF